MDLNDGETHEMQGSAAKPYVLKNIGGVYSCSCPAWRNQSAPIERRTCKHLRKLRGDEAEVERTGAPVPTSPVSAGSTDGPPLLLAHTWDNSRDLSGWWISEKLDGVRAYWDGKGFLSRQGNTYHAPEWFIEDLPEVVLDGELWMDRKSFQKTVSIVRRQDKSDHWKDICYVVFDAPEVEGAFEERMKFLQEFFSVPKRHARLLEQNLCRDLDHMREELARVETLGGEGLMMRQPGSNYQVGRSETLLKVKTFHDADAIVIGHKAGKGKHSGKLGALLVQMPGGKQFSVGTGLSDAERLTSPPIGSVITYRYQELSDDGIPRFPSFLRLRTDSDITPQEVAAAVGDHVEIKEAATPAPAASSLTDSEARYFELVDGKSSKFWEVSIDSADVTVRYGRIGANGQTRVKSFDGEDAARAHAKKLIARKTGKGYVETTG